MGGYQSHANGWSLGMVKENEMRGCTFLILHAFLAKVSRVGPFNGCVQDSLDYLSYDDTTVILALPMMTVTMSTVTTTYFARKRNAISILKLIMEKVPEQFRMRDDFGSLPIHIAVRNSHSDKRMNDENNTSLLFQFLVAEFPESVGMPTRLPCYKILVDAEPRALTTRCLVTGVVSIPIGDFWAGYKSKQQRIRETREVGGEHDV
jgi:hypothetical protein